MISEMTNRDLIDTLKVFKILRERLNGECGEECPNWIYEELTNNNGGGKFCVICEKQFHWLIGPKPISGSHCPCHIGVNPDILFFRLDEFIAELTEERNKREKETK